VVNPFLVGQDIYLRPLEIEDAGTYVRWLNDAEVAGYLEAGAFPFNRLREEEYIRNLYKNDRGMNLAIVLKQEDRHIGSVGLEGIKLADRRGVLGIVIGEKDCWGKGYGTRAIQLMLRHAFHTLNLNRISLRVFEPNKRAHACYRKVGFVEEGRLRQEHYAEGSYQDVLLMSILRPEWEGQNRTK
jgi:RimJ/RimL family protein N-acetyltransferase